MTQKWEPGPRHREESEYRYLHGTLYTQQSTPLRWDPSLTYVGEPSATPIETYALIMDRSIDDVVTEDYFAKVEQKRWLPTNPLEYNELSYHQALSALQAEYLGIYSRYKWFGTVNPLTNVATISVRPVDDDTIRKCYDAALTAAFAKVTSAADINIVVSCVELADTRKMLVKGLKSVTKLTSNLKKLWRYWRESTSKSKTTKDAYLKFEEVWMEIRMGYLPFVGECKQIYDIFTGVREYAERQTFRASKTSSSSNADSFWHSSTQYPIQFLVSRTATETYAAKAGVVCTQRFGGVPDVLGMTKLPGALWELTPCSWVVDYFFNIGDLISSWTPDPFWQVDSCWITEEKETTEVNTISGSRPKDKYHTGSLTGGHTMTKRKTVIRTVNPDRPVLPTLSPYFNWARYTDTALVTRQQFNKAFRKASSIPSKFFRRR